MFPTLSQHSQPNQQAKRRLATDRDLASHHSNQLIQALRQRQIQAVLWDLDGTLVDSEGSFQAQAFTRSMQIVHEQTPPLNAMGIPHTVGKTPDEIFDDMCENVGIPAVSCENDQLMAARQSLLKKIIRDGAKLMPGVAEALTIFNQSGVRQAVASQSPQWQAEMVVKSAGIAPYFDLIIGGDRVPANRRKPEPDLYHMAARQLGVSNKQSLVLEDTMIGATAGTRSGSLTVLIPTSYNQHERNQLGPTLLDTLANIEGLAHIVQNAALVN